MAQSSSAGRYPVEMIRDIEERLSQPLFQGVPIGATLTDFFFINFINGHLSLRRTAALKAALGWWRFCLWKSRRREHSPRLQTGRLLLTWLSDTPRFNDLVLPVIAELDPQQCNVVGNAPLVKSKLDPAIGYCTMDQAILLDLDHSEWRREYAQCRAAWHSSLRQWLRDHRLSRRLFPHLATRLPCGPGEIWGSATFLDAVRPTAVLTESEHNNPSSCLILAARQRIPTATMMHGVIYSSYGYTPLLSDVALCWGREQAEQMIEFGASPSVY